MGESGGVLSRRRKNLTRGLLAIGLSTVLVGGVASSAWAAGPAPTLEGPSDAVGETFELFGSASALGLTRVAVYVAGTEFEGPPLCSVSVDLSGDWSCTIARDDLPGASTTVVAYELPLLGDPESSASDPSVPLVITADPYTIPPPTPSITSPATGASVAEDEQPVTVTGVGGLPSGPVPVTIEVLRWDGTAYQPVCSAAVTAEAWTCTLATTLPVGSHQLIARQTTQGETPRDSEPVSLTITESPPDPVPSPSPPPAPGPPAPSPGGGGDGGAQPSADTPSTPPPAASAPPTQQPEAISRPEVSAADDPDRPDPDVPAGASDGGGPSGWTGVLTSPMDVVAKPTLAGAAAAAALVLTLVVVLPADLVASGIRRGRFLRFTRVANSARRIGVWFGRHRVLGATLLVLTTSIAFAFVDPRVGFDLTTIRLVLSGAAALVLIGVVPTLVVRAYARRVGAVVTVTLHPGGLILAIGGVILSRLMMFLPGFLVAAVLGVQRHGLAGRDLPPNVEMRLAIARSGTLLGIATLAWLCAEPLSVGAQVGGFPVALLADAATATAVGASTTLVMELLPFGVLEGGAIFAASKLRWAGCFALAGTMFALIVLPRADIWLDVGDSWLTWVTLAALFVVACVVAFVLIGRRARPAQRTRGDTVSPWPSSTNRSARPNRS
jgi:hypothetical protein